MKMFVKRMVLLPVVLLAVLAVGAGQEQSPADFVDPFIGTAATGHTFPAACAPFGLVQAGPDTGTNGWHHCSGYRYPDRKIFRFTQTHLNGTGGADLGDLGLLPFRGEKPVPATLNHAKETATPGYYAVELSEPQVKVEIAAAPHSAVYRFTGTGRLNLLVDPEAGLNVRAHCTSFDVAADRTGFSGTCSRQGWVHRSFAFAVSFSQSALRVDAASEPKNARICSFDLVAGKPLLLKLALSAEGGVAAARRNLAVEIPAWDFEGVRRAVRAEWNKYLSRAEAEGTEDQKKSFYTSLYHLFIQPNNIADVGQKPFYSTFSCWDTFRAAQPLYTLLVPEIVPGFIDSLLEQGRRTGYLPIWTLWGKENQCMIGTHSIPMIVDWYLKGGRDVDWNAAYAQIRDTLTKEHPGRRKERWDVLDRYGYYPFDLINGESVSRTLECAYDDWCAGTMAEKLGHAEDAVFFFRRSRNWRNVFDPKLGLVRGRDSKGAWRTPYNPYSLGHGAGTGNDFTEGNAFQYTWHVMQDPQGLMEAMGGREAFVKKLDSLFAENSAAEGMGHVVDVTGLIGQYVQGNEPSHHVIYFYTLAGHPEKTAERVREVFDRFYLPKPDGLCGNDDCGQMSAWYVFGAMGFYPFNPCGGTYVLGAPQFRKVTLHLPGGKTFTVSAPKVSAANKYVAAAHLRPTGSSTARPIAKSLDHATILQGGELAFEMTDRKSREHVFSMSCKVTALNGPLATEAGRAKAIAWWRKHHFSALWLESYRHGERVATDRLVAERDAFRQAGFDVRGMITPTMLNDAGSDGKVPMVVCWSDPKARARLTAECLRAVDVFDTVILDDFLFSACGESCARCRADKAKRGLADWGEYRRALLCEVCEKDILAPVRKARPHAKFIIKYPCWYKNYAKNGYDPVRETELFGTCWIGTETRDANPNPLQACWIMDWMDRLTHGHCGGGWYDALDCAPEKFVEQAYYTILGGARESLVHCYDYLLAEDPGKTPFGEKATRSHACAAAFERESDRLKNLADFLVGAERLGFEMGKDGVSRHRFRKDGKEYLARLNTTAQAVDGLPPHGFALEGTSVVHTTRVTPGEAYEAWPMIQALGNRLICVYARAKGHDDWAGGACGAYASVSDDGGATWSAPTVVADASDVAEVPIGKGVDAKGAALFWVRLCSRGARRHVLYRTRDGKAFEKIGEPKLSPVPVQITDVVPLPDGELMSLWFATDYRENKCNGAWGTLVSADGGKAWRQTTVEKGLALNETPTEPSFVVLPDGRLFGIARTEVAGAKGGRQFQLTSADGGKMWKKSVTNIGDVWSSTPSLLLDAPSGMIFNYYYERGPGLLKCRAAKVASVFDAPQTWPEPAILAAGGRERPHDSGNANATSQGNRPFVAYYSGNPTNAAVWVLSTHLLYNDGGRTRWTRH